MNTTRLQILLYAIIAIPVAAIGQDHVCTDVLSSLTQLEERANDVEKALQPVRLLRPQEEGALRQFANARHLETARQLGVEPIESQDQLQNLLDAGRLVELESETRFWIVRDLDASIPYVLPSVITLLEDIATRFHVDLQEMGLPSFRLEISSVLRTGTLQRELRRTNENAARGRSSHEYGTTVDITYEAFAAPVGWGMEEGLCNEVEEKIEELTLERVAARKSRELTAILGRLLREMQEEGLVLVLMERFQPVFHITLAR